MGGTLLEFIGDAILATYNAPGDVPDHEAAGVGMFMCQCV